ncbi:hypothetical protein ACFRFU_22520 [Streptomyces sp. NPDC056704]|uniref:hypothetical protein n=1 Tax=Streptomyces sp. NPDC056704 TaxID=3345917 RepID=UPI0036788EBB
MEDRLRYVSGSERPAHDVADDAARFTQWAPGATEPSGPGSGTRVYAGQNDCWIDAPCLTVPEHRREHLALACVAALCTDIAARSHTASWSCSRDNRPGRLPAWTAWFRLEREYVHYVTGSPARHDHLIA